MSDSSVWKAEAESTIYQVTDYQKALIGLMPDSSEITLDLSAVEELDVSFLQLLISIRGAAANQSIKINIENVGEVVSNLAEASHCMAALTGVTGQGGSADVA